MVLFGLKPGLLNENMTAMHGINRTKGLALDILMI
jgi:hypothetical protein